MPLPINLVCRLPDCNENETFDGVEESKESDWEEISPLGVVTEDSVNKHRAYCPSHGLDDS